MRFYLTAGCNRRISGGIYFISGNEKKLKAGAISNFTAPKNHVYTFNADFVAPQNKFQGAKTGRRGPQICSWSPSYYSWAAKYC